ncbi:hypothetical protein MTY59_44970 [Mycobacterium senriense]|uniref:Uncharacterized protein n=1 Tax=Mycobacterium senriense TaxID=2775496 RepID=A0ABM7STD1_9MYCO|nr:hypothetical protein MTY59_44970 [Mycobacterium senriense]
MVGQASGGVEALHQQFERHVLVFEGGQAALAHLGQQLGERGIPGHVDPQHQGVDEEPDQLVERGLGPPGNWKAHCHIGTGADLREQSSERRLDHHEAGRVVLARQPVHLLLQLRRPVHRQASAAVVGDLRVGPVGGQLQAFGQPGKRVRPEVQLGGDAAVAVFHIAEMRALP